MSSLRPVLAIPFLLLVLSGPANAQNLSPEKLRTEYLVNPIGIDEAAPRLSWIDVSPDRGAAQAAFRIVVASSKRNLLAGDYDLWDSGKVDSFESTQIPYSGKPLASGQRAWWRVMVWGGGGNSAKLSDPAFWELGLPNSSDWSANWIGLDTAKHGRAAPFFRKPFEAGNGLVSARAYVSARGLYHFFLDGTRVDRAEFAPGWTDYRKRIQYQTYDVTEALSRPGAHVAGIVLGDGWYCGHVGLTGGNNYGTQPWGLVQLELKYRDGHTERVVSDGSWLGRTGPILDDDLLMGEDFDSRKNLEDWSTVRGGDGPWEPPLVEPLGTVPLVAQPDPPVTVVATLAPKTTTEPKPGAFVLDLGQNMVGRVQLKVSGASGDRVQLRYAEVLNPDGTIYTANLRGARATDSYTLTGKGEEQFEPMFTCHGFRYVELTGFPGTPTKDSIKGIVLTSNDPQTGWFSCSNALVNQIFHNLYWGQRGNYVSIPTDCPQRDERLGWMGDAQIFVRTAAFNNDIAAFMTKWTQDEVDAQSPAGGFADVSPRMGDQSDGAPAWGDAGVIVPYSVYQAYGDVRLIERRYPAMRRWIEYIDSVNPDHIWVNHSNNNFGDWLNVNDDTPRPVLATAYFAYSTQIVANAAKLLASASAPASTQTQYLHGPQGVAALVKMREYADDAKKYQALHDRIVEAFQQHYVAADGKVAGDSQTAYVLALWFDLLPQSLRDAAAKRLVDHIMIDRKGHLSTGFVGVGYLNPTLTSIGKPDIAYKLLLNEDYPSWGYSIRQGATTIWERWDGYTTDKGFQDPGMNSFNHYSFGSVGEWMYRSVAGIAAGSPGYHTIVIHPIPGGGLTWAKGRLDTMHGKVETSWTCSDRGFSLDVTVPANTTAEVYVPSADAAGADVREGGKPATDSSGVSFLRMQNGAAVYQVGGGRYRFESRWSK